MTIKGKVIRGDGIATSTGYPTANLSSSLIKKYNLKDGVYAAWFFLKEKRYRAACICGAKDKNGRKKLEIYVFPFHKNIYKKTLNLQIVKKIRKLIKFRNKKSLRKQIAEDLSAIDKILKKY